MYTNTVNDVESHFTHAILTANIDVNSIHKHDDVASIQFAFMPLFYPFPCSVDYFR